MTDASGYHAECTAEMLMRSGCHTERLKPVPAFAAQCRRRYQHNARVRVHRAAPGGNNYTTQIGVRVETISNLLFTLDAALRMQRGAGAVGVLKLDIEGGQYEVLEVLPVTGDIRRVRCLLIQFHRQPADYEQRYAPIVEGLQATHQRVWDFPMV